MNRPQIPTAHHELSLGGRAPWLLLVTALEGQSSAAHDPVFRHDLVLAR